MVSDFIDERNGYLRLTDEEFTQAQTKDPSIRHAIRRIILEYGESRDGYWMRNKFVEQLKQAVKIAEVK